MMGRLHTTFVLIASLFLLAACDDSPSVAGGGIGGTGTGTITGFGSVIINETRTFAVNAATEILLDDAPINEAELQALGQGMVARVVVGTDVSDDFTSGTAVSIHAVNLVKGPVTSTTPFQVLGQSVVATGDTVLANGLVLADLIVGNILEVSGHPSVNNVIQATRIELKPLGVAEWRLIGPVGNLVGNSFQIGSQTVNFGGITPEDCGTGMMDGDVVKIKAAPDPNFTSGNPLSTVTKIECLRPGLAIPDGAPPNLEAEVEGLVTSVTLPIFFVGTQQVLITGTTVFEAGEIEDIVLGARVEAEGVLDTETGVLTAEKVKFRETRVRMRAPVASADITIGESLIILGIAVKATPLTEDEDGTVASGIADAQIEVRGFVDGSGQVFATKIREHSPTADPDNVRLRGPVTDIPGLADFAILGVNVNTTATPPPLFLDVDGQSISELQFFDSIAIGSQVDVEGGNYNGVDTITSTPTTNIAIED